MIGIAILVFATVNAIAMSLPLAMRIGFVISDQVEILVEKAQRAKGP